MVLLQQIMNESEFRQDPVSGDWIILAPGRANLLHFSKTKRLAVPKKTCPFEDPQSFGNAEPVLIYGNPKKWRLQVIPNKYPSVVHRDICYPIIEKGSYHIAKGQGHHEILITRDHKKSFHQLIPAAAKEVFSAFLERYLILMGDRCLSYISIFHNWGPKAGASVLHPHYQIIAIPVIPPDVNRSLRGSAHYFKEKKQCVHCAIIKQELKEKNRIIFENKGAIAFCPFVSRSPFEVRVFPKEHLPYFEDTNKLQMDCIIEVLQKSLKKIHRHLKDPDFNFFIHTAPLKEKEKYDHYHWHLEIIPRLAIVLQASFELGTGININVVDPALAAKILRR